jgi:tetratricopeptide (TPR) repeat protein
MRRLLPLALLLLAAPVTAHAQKVIIQERIEDLETRVRADSNDPATHYNVGVGYLSKKRYADADRELRAAIALDPQFAQAYLALSLVHNWDDPFWKDLRKRGGDSLVTKTQDEFGKYERRAFLVDPLVDIRIYGATWRFSGSSHFIQGAQALMEGRYPEAYEHLDRSVQWLQGSQPLDSVSGGLVWMRGLAAAQVQNWDAATADFEALLRRAEREKKDSVDRVPLKGNELRYMMAAVRQRQGRADEAMRLYQEVAEADLGNYMAHVQLARLYEAQGQWAQCIAERRRAVDANPDDPSLLMDLGVTLGKASQYAEADSTLERAAAANPRDARPLYWLGLVRLKENRRDDAKAAFARFLALAPSRYERQIATAKQRLTELQ